MNSTIENLWYGQFSPCENCGVGDPEIEMLSLLINQSQETLCKELPMPQKEQFEKYADWSDKYARYIAACAFREGFSLGCKLISEALSET